jgi:hypothetical protein
MDAVDRRAFTVSLVIHGVLIAVTLIGIHPRGPEAPIPEPSTVLAPAPAAQEDLGFTLAEDAFAVVPAAPTLPALGARPLSERILHATPMLPPGPLTSRGSSGTQTQNLRLPESTAATNSELTALQARLSTPRAVDSAEDNRRNAATSLQIFLENAFQRQWRQQATRITNRTLVIWIETNRANQIERGGLYHCTTGVADLDLAIDRWLVSGTIGLPPITPGVIHYVRIEIP